MARKIEIASGVLGTLLGIAGLAFMVFGPSTIAVSGPSGTSMWDRGIDGPAAIYLLVMAAAVLAGSVAVYLHRMRGLFAGFVLLWIDALALWGGAFITLVHGTFLGEVSESTAESFIFGEHFGVGLYLVPAALLVTIAAVVSIAAHPEPSEVGLRKAA